VSTHLVPVIQTTIWQISTFAVIGPREPIIAGVEKLLAGILVSRTGPDLEFCSIDILATDNVQTLASKNLDGSTVERPLLRIGARAGLQGDCGAIRVGNSGHTVPCFYPVS
jgi:hypothetical protein